MNMQTVTSDVLVIGGAGAAVMAAVSALRQGASVTLAAKGKVGKSGNTIMVGGSFGIDGESAREVCGEPQANQEYTRKKLFHKLVTSAFQIGDQRMLAFLWDEAFQKFRKNCTGAEFEELYKTFAPQGATPQAGDIVRLPGHAQTLRAIGQSLAEDFYRGDLAARIAAESAAFGGYLGAEDLAAFRPEWVKPISVRYRGYDLWEIPPNGQGIVALMALNILKEFSLEACDEIRARHLQWEAIKLAFADARHYVTDPAHMRVDYHQFLDPAFGAARAREITEQAGVPRVSDLPASGTVYLCAADEEGTMRATVIDAAQVDYVSSFGLRSLLNLGKMLEPLKGDIHMCSLQPQVSKIFIGSGFGNLFPVFPTVDAALKAFGKRE